MNRRTQYLLLAMILVGLILFGDKAYRKWIEGPAERDAKLAVRLQEEINEAKLQIAAGKDLTEKLDRFERQSLPYKVEMAKARYQQWLLDLVQQGQLENASVNAEQPVSVFGRTVQGKQAHEILKRYSFNLGGRGDLRQILGVLHAFYAGPHLHKIVSLTLNPISSSGKMDLNLKIEALGLARCQRADTLAEGYAPRTAWESPEAYNLIVRRNFFSTQADALLTETQLTAITYTRSGAPEVWLSTSTGPETMVLSRGQQIHLGAHRLEVLEVLSHRVLLQLDGHAAFLEIGQSLQDRQEVPAVAAERQTQPAPPRQQTIR